MWLQFLLNANIDEIKISGEHLVLKNTTLLIASYINGFDLYDEKA